jgi:hypothetical protein
VKIRLGWDGIGHDRDATGPDGYTCFLGWDRFAFNGRFVLWIKRVMGLGAFYGKFIGTYDTWDRTRMAWDIRSKYGLGNV